MLHQSPESQQSGAGSGSGCDGLGALMVICRYAVLGRGRSLPISLPNMSRSKRIQDEASYGSLDAEDADSDDIGPETATASAMQAVGSGAAKVGADSGRAVAAGARWLLDSTSERAAQLFAAAQGLVASDLSPQLNDLVQAAVKGKATIYDKAMDAEFLATHIGGGNHRLFDGGHTLFGAIKATHGASPDDTLIQEALGGMQGLLRDVSTPKGLPLANWDKPTYDSVANSLQSTFGMGVISGVSQPVTSQAGNRRLMGQVRRRVRTTPHRTRCRPAHRPE